MRHLQSPQLVGLCSAKNEVNPTARTRLEARPPGPLTPRQLQVLRGIAAGKTTKAIARSLSISVKTVETHRSLLMERLSIRDVAGLVRYALRFGLVSADE